MFSHIMIGSNDIARSKKFYDALFAAMGAKPGVEDAKGRLIYAHNGGRLMVTKPIDGKPASAANGGTIGFTMSDAQQAEAWHKAGVANGGTSIEDPPGVRQMPSGRIYLAYLRDPDGNKLCGLHRLPAA
ncbi:MAG: VOC family protein [Betaproteobacteria bacterium]|nr:VOC family protein [Betaproteobacteria bacterium]